jgi:hypothetical protein
MHIPQPQQHSCTGQLAVESVSTESLSTETPCTQEDIEADTTILLDTDFTNDMLWLYAFIPLMMDYAPAWALILNLIHTPAGEQEGAEEEGRTSLTLQ